VRHVAREKQVCIQNLGGLNVMEEGHHVEDL
jgi:hypothetical protein